jgi:rSAM/selenodomain-associated transferase 1
VDVERRSQRRAVALTIVQPVLLVMARQPEVGRVKTRLAGAIGAEQACALYRAFLHDLAHRFAGRHYDLVWAVHPAGADFRAAVGESGRCIPQIGADLAERMHQAVASIIAAGADRVVMIGADCPHIRDAWIDEALQALDENDVVLGPSTDGGYYLVALRQAHDLFRGAPMGTSRVLAETLARARLLRLRVHLLPQTFDVDEMTDLERLRDELRMPELARLLSETQRVLTTLP